MLGELLVQNVKLLTSDFQCWIDLSGAGHTMRKLSCRCLNVHICIKSEEDTLSTIPVQDLTCQGDYCLSEPAQVQLDLEGVKFEHAYLVKTQQVGDWLLHKCVICNTVTHATRTFPDSGHILISKDALCDSITAEALMKSADYCPLYRVVLSERNDNQPVRSLGVQSERYESLKEILGEIQQQLNTFLVQEEAAMEERINAYMESERAAYAELQSKMKRHKNTMVNLVLASEQRQLMESFSDMMSESPTTPLSPPSQTSDDGVRQPQPEQSTDVIESQHQFPSEHLPSVGPKKLTSLSERLKTGSRLHHPVQEAQVTSTVSADGDFDFDTAFQDDSNQAFYTSDDETEDTDDSECDWRGVQNKDERSIYSASVPISVPMWGRSTKKSFAEDVDEDELPQDGASMAASIKALAQSVHGDGTEMFGELPRPRINMSDFSKL